MLLHDVRKCFNAENVTFRKCNVICLCIKQVEKAKAQFLHIIGGADLNWPSEGMADQSIERMTTHGKDNYELLKYEHAGHLIEPPYAPVCIKSYHKTWGK